MKIAIDIDDDLYTRLFDNGEIDAVDLLNACTAIRKGMPLPKGHGRLIDADEVIKIANKTKDLHGAIWNAPTIIEADKQYEVEVITRGKCMMCGKELTEGLFFCNECEDKASNVRKMKESEDAECR